MGFGRSVVNLARGIVLLELEFKERVTTIFMTCVFESSN